MQLSRTLTKIRHRFTIDGMELVLQVVAAVLISGSALSIWRHSAWWVRAWDFPRTQILVIGLVIILGMLWIPARSGVSNLLLILLAASMLLQAWRIFPYTRLAQYQTQPATSTNPDRGLALMVSNVLMENRRAEPLLQTVRQRRPDVFFVVEVEDWWIEQLAPLKEDFPYFLEHPLDNTYGLALYSRLELVDPNLRYLFDEDVPSVHSRLRVGSGEIVHLHLLHPKPPYPAESTTTTERDAEILRVGREIAQHDRPTIVAGDLNDVAWSHTTRLFQRISGMLDPRIGRGLYSTFHAQIPIFRWPLDHVFHSDHFTLRSLERLPAIGSDHFPILARLQLEPNREDQEAPQPHPGDRTEAIEKIDAADADAGASPDTTLISVPDSHLPKQS